MKPSLGVVLVVVVALAAAGVNGEDLSAMHVVLEGERAAPGEALLVVGGGTATVPAGTTHDGSVYVVAGEARIDGRVRGNVVVVSGAATLGDGAVVTGDLEVFGGDLTDRGATVAGRRQEQPAVVEAAPGRDPRSSLLAHLLLAAVGAGLVRWRPGLPANVGDAAAAHPLVSVTVGGLTTAAAVALFVLMAFTIVLIPLGVLGALVGVAAIAYGYVGLGHRLGAALPVGRRDLATAAGVFGVSAGVDLLQAVPVVGGLAALSVSMTGLGAVLTTYFGVVPFEPPSLS